ncbi:HAD family hydrolase [Nonomuraea sp. NPDC002799]
MPKVSMVAFDLDGTLTRGPSCLEVLAQRYGFADQMAIWEQAREPAEIVAARRGVRELLDNQPPMDQSEALHALELAPRAIEGIELLHAHDIETVIVSLAYKSHANVLAERVGIRHVIATELLDDGTFNHVFPATKPLLLAEYANQLDMDLSAVAAVGDSVGDVPMLSSVGTSIYVGWSLPDGFQPTMHLPHGDIRELAHHLLDHTIG